MEEYRDCTLCVIDRKGEAVRCRRCKGRLRGRERLLFEIGEETKTRKRAALLSCFAPGLGQMYTGRWAAGVTLGLLIPLSLGLVAVTWSEFTYGHGFVIGAAAFVLLVAVVDARFGPRSRIAPCQQNCPAEVGVPDYLQLLANGEYREGYSFLRSRIPLVGVIGRICPHPCEDRCIRGIDGEPISINGCKRFLADENRKDSLRGSEQRRGVVQSEGEGANVAVVGSGPAGLSCAYFLRILGIGVTVYDAQPVPGGRLGLTIPEHRLPADILHEELEDLRARGVVFRLESSVGPGGISVSQLLHDHAALFIGIGAQISIPLRIPGSDMLLDFQEVLRSARQRRRIDIGSRICVIGGGNAALDVCRTAVRLGAEQVHLLYRRSREEMPARPGEIEESIREGVQFHYLADPAELRGEKGEVQKLVVRKMRLGGAGADGRPTPIPMPGEEWELEVDAVIPALGQTVGGLLFEDSYLSRLRREADGRIWVDCATQRTSLARTYAGGDVVSGPATAVGAMAQGRRAALGIYSHLFFDAIPMLRLRDRRIRKRFKISRDTPQARIREEMPMLSARARLCGLAEVEEGLKESAATREAGRCLQCHREL